MSFTTVKAQLNDLIIVEYVDWSSGSGYAIKVCNYSGSAISLSGYRLQIYNNASTTPSVDEVLSGVVANGSCVRIGNPGMASNCALDYTVTGTTGVNGDDAVVLTDLSGSYVDMINGPGFDTDQRIQGNNNALRFNTITRQSDNCNRYTNTTGSGPNSWPLNNNNNVPGWTVSGVSCLTATNFTFNQPTVNENRTICQGDSILINGIWRKSSGNFQLTVPSPTGCDTLKNINLSVLQNSQTTLNQELCAGESFIFNNKTYTAIGTFQDTLTKLSNGCDSIFTINITQKPYKNGYDTLSICTGESYAFNNQNLTLAGDYRDTIVIANDCDSIINLRLNVKPMAEKRDTVRLCFGENYAFNGQLLANSGDYRDTMFYSNSCDTILLLNLQIRPKNEVNVQHSICEGDSYFVGGANQFAAGTYYDTLTSFSGCDSIIITNLQLDPLLERTEEYTICKGAVLNVRGIQVKSDTTFSLRLTNGQSCDSLISVKVKTSGIKADFSYQLNDLSCSFYNESFEADAFQWFIDDSEFSIMTNPTYNFKNEGMHAIKLVVNNQNGCTDSITKPVVILPESDRLLFIPNAFTPNNDGINDYFIVKHSEYFEFYLTIFNRWGEMIYSTTDLDFRWNGRYKGEDVPAGTYYYLVEGKFSRKGNLSLIR